ncbi:hypothetical protein EMCRGX_G032688 [Ephydatia muelleri]
MVYAKVTDGKEIRKFRVESDVTFDALKKQIAGLFPSLSNGVEFNVQYRDAVGDVISISTDEEVRTALSHLSANETWLLQAVPVPRRAQRASGRGAPTKAASREVAPFGGFTGGLLGRILDDMNPFWTPATSLVGWSDPLERADELEKEWRRQTEQLRKMQEDHTKQFEEQRKKAEADLQKTLKERQSGGKGGEVAKSGEPKWHVQTFGSWEPQMMESPHGSRTVIGPVGYHMYWGYSDPAEEPKPQGEQPAQQQGEQKREETKPAEASPAQPTTN